MTSDGRHGLSISGDRRLGYAYWGYCFARNVRTLGADPSSNVS